MAGLTNIQVASLRHNGNMFNDGKRIFCLSTIWHTTSDESYSQRTDIFDDTIFNKDSPKYVAGVDEYLMAYLYHKLSLTVIKQYSDVATELETDLNGIYAKSENVLLLHNPKKVQSFLYALDSKIRNSIAHGTMNFPSINDAIFYGQFKKIQSSNINFYLTTKHYDALENWYNERDKLAAMSLYEFQKTVYTAYFGNMQSTSDNSFLLDNGSCVIFDNTFRFKEKNESGDQDTQLLNRIENELQRLDIDSNVVVDYLIMDMSVSAFKKIINKYPRIRVIPYNKLLSHLGI